MDVRIEPNTLAAFLEGRLLAEERAQVIAQLNLSGENRELVVDALDLLTEIEPTRAEHSAGRFPFVRHRRMAAGLVLAATLAAVVIGRAAFAPGPSAGDVLTLAAKFQLSSRGTGTLAGTFGAEWAQAGWTVTRGAQEDLPEEANEFRVGARFAALNVAVMNADTLAADQLLPELGLYLTRVTGATSVVAILMGPRRAENETLELRHQQARAALFALLGDSPWFRLGLWSQLAWFAALRNESAFFDEDGRQVLQDIAADLALDARGALVLRAVDGIQATWPTDAPTAEFRARLIVLMRSAGR